jgi:leucyl/phenylalanyl-tRNA--protein transferase
VTSISLPLAPHVEGAFPAESMPDRLRRYALALGYLVRPVRVADAPAIALGTLRDLVIRPPRLPRVERAVGKAGFAGLVADPSPDAIVAAGRLGFYPSAHMGPLKWWSPPDRAIMALGDVDIAKRFRRTLRTTKMTVAFDQDFIGTMLACAAPRPGRTPLTWITPRAMRLYAALHAAGHAHSVEVRDEDGTLVGGLFGTALGPVFSAMSMFHTANDASKIAIVSLYHHLETWGFSAVDHQVLSPWVETLGGRTITRTAYGALLAGIGPDLPPGRWTAVHTPAATSDWQPKPIDLGLPPREPAAAVA